MLGAGGLSHLAKTHGFFLLLAAILVISTLIQLRGIGAAFDFDSYDEGVYWQTLRAISEHETLCAQVFCSQPPMFILLIWPFFKLFGGGILAARLGVLILSTLGDAAGAWLGYELGGRAGSVAALLLLEASSLHQFTSRTLVAEEPSLSFVMLAMASACAWARPHAERPDIWKLVLSAAALALGILCKLSAITALVPIAMLVCVRFAWQKPIGRPDMGRCFQVLMIFTFVFLAVLCICLLPLLSADSSLIDQLISFHLSARAAFSDNPTNVMLLKNVALGSAALIAAAISGFVQGLWRHDIRIFCAGAWLLLTLIFLAALHPLFPRHLVLVFPPLACLAAAGFSAGPLTSRSGARIFLAAHASVTLAAIIFGLQSAAHDRSQLTQADVDRSADAQKIMANEIRRYVPPGEWIITDAPFAAALAERSTPPNLVDTSVTRIVSHYLTDTQLLGELSNPRVKAVLLATGRLSRPEFAGFRASLNKSFTLRTAFPSGAQLWTR